MKFYKFRVIFLAYIIKFLTKILFVEMIPIVSVTALIKNEDKMLFIDLSYLKGLGIPGGIIQGEEDLEEALKREVMEETGLSVTSSKYLWSIPSFSKGLPTLSVIFLAETNGEARDSREGTLIWMEPEKAIGKLVYDSNTNALKKYLGKKYE